MSVMLKKLDKYCNFFLMLWGSLIISPSNIIPQDNVMDSLYNQIMDFQIHQNFGKSLTVVPIVFTEHNNNYRILWYDTRNGPFTAFSQRIVETTEKYGGNTYALKVHSSGYKAASDSMGNFILFWRYIENKFFLQKFDREGQPLSKLFNFTHDKFFSFVNKTYEIYVSPEGEITLALVGRHKQFPNEKIWVIKFSPELEPIGEPLLPFSSLEVEDKLRYDDLIIKSTPDSSFIITVKCYNDIYLQKFKVDRIFKKDIKLEEQVSHYTIDVNNEDSCIVLGYTKDERGDELYLKKFSSEGVLLKDAIRIDQNNDSENKYDINIVTTENHETFILWRAYFENDSHLFFQYLDSKGELFREDNYYGNGFYPGVAELKNGNIVITYNKLDVFCQVLSPDGSFITSRQVINNNEGSSSQKASKMVLTDEHFVIVWNDKREATNQTDIYMNSFNRTTGKAFGEIKVNEDYGTGSFSYPNIAKSSSGRIAAVWNDSRENYTIHGQYFDIHGNIVGSNFQVTQDNFSFWSTDYTVSLNSSNHLLCVWVTSNFWSELYAQFIDENGSPVGGTLSLTEDIYPPESISPSCKLFDDNTFLVMWENGPQATYGNVDHTNDVFIQKFNKNGEAISEHLVVNDDGQKSVYNTYAKMSVGGGNVVVTWVDDRNGSFDVYGQILDTDGNRIGYNFIVNDNLGEADKKDTEVSVDKNGNFVITWADKRNGTFDVYAQCFDKEGNPWKSNFQVNSDTLRDQFEPAVVLDGKDLYFSWTTNHVEGKGYNVWTNSFIWDSPVDINNTQIETIPKIAAVSSYPNPFNASAKISYFIPQTGKVELNLYDVQGRLLKTLYEGSKTRGKYFAELNSIDLSSGVYFVVLNFNNSQKLTHKIMHLK